MPSTLSANDDGVGLPDKLVPLNQDKEPIKYSGNPAHMLGALHEVDRFWRKQRLFQSFLKDGAVQLKDGKMAVDTFQAIPFIKGTVIDPTPHGFTNPCPATPARVSTFDAAAVAASTERPRSWHSSPHL